MSDPTPTPEALQATPTPASPPEADSGLRWSCDECQVAGVATSRFGAIYAERLHRARAHGGVLPVHPTQHQRHITRYSIRPDCWDRLGSIARIMFRIDVTLADPDTDRWAITRAGQRLSRANQWHYEPAPSERTQGWAKAHQFELQDAIRRAEAIVETMVVAGETADQCAEREERQRAQGGEDQ